MQKFLKIIWSIVLDTLFPVYCLGCGREGGVLCTNCMQELRWQKVERCPLCRVDSSGGVVCRACQPSALSGAVAGFIYSEDDLMGKLIKAYKYDFQDGAGEVISHLVSEQVATMGDFFKRFDLIVPVPLHRFRFAERGFNQAEKIAQAIESGCGRTISRCLKRVKNTPRQASLGRGDRLKNLAGAFLCNQGVLGKKILLVDDVLTTGSTFGECARVLREAGAKEVWGYTVARG